MKLGSARRLRFSFILSLLIALAGILAPFVKPAGATTFTVDRLDDTAAATACTVAGNDCSLRGAVIAANTNPGADTINLQAGATYNLSLGPSDSTIGAIVPATGDLDITDSVTISGLDATINANSIDRVMDIQKAGGGTITVNIVTLKVTGGKAQGLFSFGGGINARGCTLNLTRVQIFNCTTDDLSTVDNGGGLAINSTYLPPSPAALTMTDSTVRNNTGLNGGGIVVGSATVNLTRCTVSGNTSLATYGGGDFHCGTASAVQIVNSTISSNTTAAEGGGISQWEGQTTLKYSTVTLNNAAGTGGGLRRIAGPFNLQGTILSGNTFNAVQQDATGTFESQDFNLIKTLAGIFLNGPTGNNVTGVDAQLGPLQNNGGFTFTHALQSASPALDKGQTATAPSNDQRSQNRPRDGNGDGIAISDIGAFELRPQVEALNDSYSVLQGVPLTIPAPGVLANDSDAIGFAITAVKDTNPLNGGVVLNPNGGFTYTPNAAFVGVDSFKYHANNGSVNSAQATVTITVLQKFTINGRVSDGAAMGVQNVSVALTVTGGGSLANGVVTPILTNSAGYFTFNAPNGNYTITPSQAGFVFNPATRNCVVNNANVINQNFTQLVAYTIIGRISDAASNAIQNVSVAISPVPGLAPSPVFTNSAGYFTFTGIPNGAYTITPSMAGLTFNPVNRSVNVAGANVTGQNFIGASGFTVTGRVTDSAVMGIQNVSVALSVTGGGALPPGIVSPVLTNSAGYYTINNVPNGNFTITPTKAGLTFAPVNKQIVVSGADVANQNFIGS